MESRQKPGLGCHSSEHAGTILPSCSATRVGAEDRKNETYSALLDTHIFIPVAIETLGPINEGHSKRISEHIPNLLKSCVNIRWKLYIKIFIITTKPAFCHLKSSYRTRNLRCPTKESSITKRDICRISSPFSTSHFLLEITPP